VRVGYLRSEGSQDEIDRAMAALEAAATDRVVFDSTPRNRPESSAAFVAFIARMNRSDTLVVTDLGQLARTMERLLERLADLIERGVRVETLSGELDTSDPAAGRTIMTLWSFETRTRNARNRSRPGNTAGAGRPRRLSAEAIGEARRMLEGERRSVAEAARRLGVSRATLYRALKRT
jgi:DNA invertase Pin-like site-specific DNA recombinase